MIDVAVGVICKGSSVLIAERPQHLHCGGMWEFPGGKIEKNELPEQALQRELFEEIGIQVKHAEPFMVIRHDYPDKTVNLQIFLVHEFTGEPSGCEGQVVQWFPISDLTTLAFPAANQAIITALSHHSKSDRLAKVNE